nr:MAG TPA: hypothetical protein [Caudoviricetes sp.]
MPNTRALRTVRLRRCARREGVRARRGRRWS